MKMVTSEVIKIIIGSIGLVVVAPITTYIASFIYSVKEKSREKKTFSIAMFYKKQQEL